ncbi:MAG: hypothetical protein Q4G52_03050 [Clostridia bacterium]|nr:hypothetical protein [Clostridia bacterium]
MEMTSPRPERPARPIRGPHGGWQKQEIDALAKSIEEAARSGQSLRSVFERMGQQLGRKPNSIRNFYYAQVREEGGAPRAMPFETFAPDEVESLIRSVLTARARGMSVRACVRELAGGDRTKMLRYQNKYRSTVRTRPELVESVMRKLSEEGVPFVSPYAAETAQPEPELSALRERAEASGDPQLSALFASLDHLLSLALDRRDAAPDAVPETAKDSEALRRADRLNARCDMLRIALSDEQTRRGRLREQTQDMVTLIKEYIALPDGDRQSGCAAFCEQAARRLSAVECALMEE